MAGRVEKVPQVMQMEALECGAACLTMILAYYGRWVPLEQVRADCGVSRDGSKATNILKTARRYGLEAKGMTFSTKALALRGTFPCILFWNFNHFVVLAGFRGKYAYLNDPARGQVRVSIEEFDKSFTGVVLMFAKTDAFEPGGEPPSAVKGVLERIKGLRAPIAFVMLTAAATSLLGIISTSLTRVLLDYIIPGITPDWLFPVLAILLAAALLSGLVGILNAVYLARIQGKIAVVSSSRFMRHLLRLPVEFYSQRMVGDLQQRQSANETIAFTMVGQLAPVLISAFMLILYLIAMLRYSVLLTLVGISSILLNVIIANYTSKKRVNVARSMAMDSGKLYSSTVGGIEMIETIKAAGAENGYFQRWSGFQASVSEGRARISSINEYLGTLPALVTSLSNVAVLVLGIWLIVRGDLTPGSLLVFQSFLASFMTPVSQLITIGQSVQEMQTQMERVDDVMRYKEDVPAETPDDEREEDLLREDFGRDKLRGKVDLTGITFGYSPLEPPLIENFDLHIKPGKWVALVGGSGCGKSTIAKLVSGLYQPWAGEVRFDDIPAAEVPRSVLRGSLAVVDQDIVTFDDTISDNIKMWDRSIEDYEVVLACRDADIHGVISEREGGYASRILPGGRNFSGGQLQRMEIARVLAQDPTVIILDEATSALDTQTEEKVVNHIRDREITCIVVAHRLSTIRDCDEIIVLDDGKVLERGTHDELMALDGFYAQLVRSD